MSQAEDSLIAQLDNTVIGIHTNGVSRFGLCPKRNAGTRITQGLFSVILNIAR